MCVSYQTIVELVIVDGPMTNTQILDDNLQDSIENRFQDAKIQFIFQRNNAPVHAARNAQTS